ncbi:unnamed protein product, partial [Polarella glacialis]
PQLREIWQPQLPQLLEGDEEGQQEEGVETLAEQELLLEQFEGIAEVELAAAAEAAKTPERSQRRNNNNSNSNNDNSSNSNNNNNKNNSNNNNNSDDDSNDYYQSGQLRDRGECLTAATATSAEAERSEPSCEPCCEPCLSSADSPPLVLAGKLEEPGSWQSWPGSEEALARLEEEDWGDASVPLCCAGLEGGLEQEELQRP